MEEKKELSFEEVNDIRKLIVDAVRSIDDASGKRFKLSNLDCSKKLLNRIIFDYYKNCEYMPYKYFYNKFERQEIMEKLDFDGVDFSDFNCIGFDFGDVKGTGIKINPQTIYKKNLSNVICSGVEFRGPFDGVDISGANFTGSKGAKINPQTIFVKDLERTVCTDVEFIGPFDDAKISGANFTGSKGAMIDPQTIYKKNLRGTRCTDVEFIGLFDRAMISGADFTGSKGAVINPQTIYDNDLNGTKCSNVEFIGPFDRIMISGADFTGSKGAMIDPQTIYDKNLLRTVCTDVEFTGSFDNVRMNDETLLEGSNARYIDSYERIKESINKLIK